MKNRPTAIIFDWDNTLVDTWDILHKAMNNTLILMNKDIVTIEELKKNCFLSMREIFPSTFGDRWEEAAKIYRNEYISHSADKLKLMPDVKALLSFIYDNTNIYTGIISNKNGDLLRKEVEYFGLNKYFKKIVGSGDAAKDKPSILTMELVLENSDIKIDQNLWYIGDTLGDIEFAQNIGCAQIFYDCDHNTAIYNHYPEIIYLTNYQKLINYLKI